jgi:2-succinyl-5-enolpyruvyl-6-hydroxy-3-cyclohexene-1-carboxylate synthase
MKEHKITASDMQGIFSLIEACHHFGIENVILCPGSRNAALIISFNRSGLFNCHSIADERVAGFYALGMSLATQKPVAVACTSGSAATNLSPALVEAFYLKAPVVAITADRPLAWTDQGNGQTIRQRGLFKNFTVHDFSLITIPKNEDEAWLNRRKLSECFATALIKNRGPAHINVPMAEPLYGHRSYLLKQKPPFYRAVSPDKVLTGKQTKDFAKAISNARSVMILPGQMLPNENFRKCINSWSKLGNVAVLTETTANLEVPNAIDTIDRVIIGLLNPEKRKKLMPEILITTGGYVVSKRIKKLLRDFRPAQHWHLNPYDSGLDTFQSLSHEIAIEPELFLNAVLPKVKLNNSTYSKSWKALKDNAERAHKSFMRQAPYSDLSVFGFILGKFNSKVNLHLSNSSTVRYVQLFGHQRRLNYFGNRGTSGIDGCTSTAAGYALANQKEKNILITGDVAFRYDSNALWNKNFPNNLKIIVINNDGGGIFRIIEGPGTTDELEDFFEAHHPGDIGKLASTYDIPFFSANDMDSLKAVFNKFTSGKGTAILEVKTPRKQNAKVLADYFKHIHQRIE